MVSLLKRLTGGGGGGGGAPQSERRPAAAEVTDTFLARNVRRSESPFKVPQMALAKIVAISNAVKATQEAGDGGGDQDSESAGVAKDTVLSLKDLNNNEDCMPSNAPHLGGHSGHPRLAGASQGTPEGAAVADTGRRDSDPQVAALPDPRLSWLRQSGAQSGARSPTARALAGPPNKPLLELAGRRNSCIASIRVSSPMSAAVQQRRLAASALSGGARSVDLQRLLGAGGFGSVYKGTVDRQMVAVKQLHARTRNERAQAESLRAEANAQALRHHPNIVRVLGAWRRADTHCVIMEYVGDLNLAQLLAAHERRPLDPLRRAGYALDIAAALAFIHAHSLVHLDVKPANILVTPYDSCKLGDFGCCQVLEDSTGRVSPTQRSCLTGTFAYRAPELLRGEAPCARADIYSLGVTLWQMATRRQPYSGQNQHVVVFGVVAYNLRPDCERKGSVPVVTSARRHVDSEAGDESEAGEQTERSEAASVSGEAENSVVEAAIACGEAASADGEAANACGEAERFFRALWVRCWSPRPGDRPSASAVEQQLAAWKSAYLATEN